MFFSKCIGGDEVPALVVKSLSSSSSTCGGDLGSGDSQLSLQMKAVSDGIVRANRNVTIDIIQVDTVAGVTQPDQLRDKFDVCHFYTLHFKL